MEDFGDLIAFLCGEGDVAYIVDANPYVGEVIVLNFDKITSFDNVTPQNNTDRKYKMTVCSGDDDW